MEKWYTPLESMVADGWILVLLGQQVNAVRPDVSNGQNGAFEISRWMLRLYCNR